MEKKKAVKETKELETDIHSFTNTGNEIDVQAIMRHIEIVIESEKVLDALAEIKSSIQALDTNFGKVIDGQNNLLLVDKLNQIKESYDELLTKYEALLLQNVSSTEESIKVYQETDENIEARIR